MKNITILALALLLSSCSYWKRDISIKSGEISMSYDQYFNLKVHWLPAGQNSIVEFDSTIQPCIVVNGKKCQNFKIDRGSFTEKRIEDEEFGPAYEALVTGIFEEGDIKIERQTRLLLPDKFKDAVIFNTQYRNLGSARVHIDKVYTQSMLLKSTLVKTESDSADFASFQGG